MASIPTSTTSASLLERLPPELRLTIYHHLGFPGARNALRPIISRRPIMPAWRGAFDPRLVRFYHNFVRLMRRKVKMRLNWKIENELMSLMGSNRMKEMHANEPCCAVQMIGVNKFFANELYPLLYGGIDLDLGIYDYDWIRPNDARLGHILELEFVKYVRSISFPMKTESRNKPATVLHHLMFVAERRPEMSKLRFEGLPAYTKKSLASMVRIINIELATRNLGQRAILTIEASLRPTSGSSRRHAWTVTLHACDEASASIAEALPAQSDRTLRPRSRPALQSRPILNLEIEESDGEGENESEAPLTEKVRNNKTVFA